MSQSSNFQPPDLGKLSSKTTNLLLEHAVTTDDDPPDEVGPIEKRRKPRHPKKELEKDQPIVDLSDKSVLLFPGQGIESSTKITFSKISVKVSANQDTF